MYLIYIIYTRVCMCLKIKFCYLSRNTILAVLSSNIIPIVEFVFKAHASYDVTTTLYSTKTYRFISLCVCVLYVISFERHFRLLIKRSSLLIFTQCFAGYLLLFFGWNKFLIHSFPFFSQSINKLE